MTDKNDFISDNNTERELAKCRKDFAYFAEKYLTIVNKERQMQPLRFNAIQRKYIAAKTDFDIILKARKVGITTFKCAEYFHNTLFVPNTITTIIAHNLDTTIEIFDKIKMFYERLPDWLKPKASRSNRRELVFTKAPDGSELNSKYTVGTAGNIEFGRGKDIDNLHLSEYAFYREPEKIKLGAMQSLRSGGRISIESTANGYNDFRVEWQKAKSGESIFKPHFFAWHDDPSCILPREENEPTIAERELMARHGLTAGQAFWYLRKKAQLGEMIRQEYPFNDAEAFLISTRNVFDIEALKRLMDSLVNIKPSKSEDNGRLKIWQMPVEGRLYAAGADCAEGIEGGDYSCCIVLDTERCMQVAELHGKWPAHVFARKCFDLCSLYNSAVLAVERNNHGHAVINVLANQLCYPALYQHRDYDEKGALRAKPGWDTNTKSKPIMIDEMSKSISEGSVGVMSEELVKECMSYVYNDRGGMGAEPGCYDDRVMALAIALQARKNREFSLADFRTRSEDEE
jgi:hypothetical protein